MVKLAIAACLLVPSLLGCAQIVGIEQDSYLVDGDPGASDLSTTQPDAGAEANAPFTPGQEAAAPTGYGPWCNNEYCDWSEDKESCPGDCKPYVCGNHACEAGEDVTACAVDCGEPSVCGDSKCEPAAGETVYNCPDDCSG